MDKQKRRRVNEFQTDREKERHRMTDKKENEREMETY